MSGQVYFHEQYGPYQQRAVVMVNDGGNGLPIHLGMETGDPFSSTSNSMTITQAKRYRNNLTAAINAAEAAGIRDAGH